MKRRRHIVADRAVRAYLVVVSAPSLAFLARFVEAQKPVGIEALCAELAVQRFDEGVVGWLAGTAVAGRLVGPARYVLQTGPSLTARNSLTT